MGLERPLRSGRAVHRGCTVRGEPLPTPVGGARPDRAGVDERDPGRPRPRFRDRHGRRGPRRGPLAGAGSLRWGCAADRDGRPAAACGSRPTAGAASIASGTSRGSYRPGDEPEPGRAPRRPRLPARDGPLAGAATPGRGQSHDRDDPPRPIQQHCVDREAHPERVDRAAWGRRSPSSGPRARRPSSPRARSWRVCGTRARNGPTLSWRTRERLAPAADSPDAAARTHGSTHTGSAHRGSARIHCPADGPEP